MEPRLFLIIPCAGTATRMGFDKILTPLCGRAVLNRTLAALAGLPWERTVIPVAPGREEEFRAALEYPAEVVAGGECRADSVRRALKALASEEDFDGAPAYVAVHDGARPFVSPKTVRLVYEAALSSGAAIAAAPVTATVKVAAPDGSVASTPDRRLLYAAATPQIFRLHLLRAAYDALSGSDLASFTDEASLVERLGAKVTIVKDTPDNVKLTCKRDWDFAAWQLEKR